MGVAEYLAPSLGVVFACMMNAAPIQSLKGALAAGYLGSLNPTPWAFMFGNCLGWIAYSYLTKDPFVFYANAPGLMLSLWLNITAIKLQYSQLLNRFGDEDHSDTPSDHNQQELDKTTRTIASRKANSAPLPSAKSFGIVANEKLIYFIALIWMIILSSVGLLPWLEHHVKVNIVGICSNINLIFFFGAPLSSIAVVLRLRSSQPIHRKTLLLNTLNASFWCIYGISIHDYFILLPNLAGLSLGLIQVLLCVIFPQEIFLVQEEQSVQLNVLAVSTDSQEVTLDYQQSASLKET